MDLFRIARDRMRALVNPRAVDKEMDQEHALHLQLLIEEYEQAGMTRAEAERAARLRFGNRSRIKDRSRDIRGSGLAGDVIRDVRYALRTFVRAPGFTATVVLTLALGIGANTLIFSLVNATLLRSLPYPDADRLAVIWFTPPGNAGQKFSTNSGAYFILRDNSTTFESMGAARLNEAFNVGQDSDASSRDWVPAQWFSPDMIRLLGIQPQLGRWPTGEDAAKGFHVVISHGLWQRMFAESPSAIGAKIRTDALVATVSGVMPRGYQLLNPDTQLWVRQPDENLRTATRSPNRIFTLVGRLKPGVTIEQAQAEMSSLVLRVGEELPATHRGWGVRVESLREAYVAGIRKPLLIFQGAVCFVLLIACANVAGLMLAKAGARQKELAMRTALGSGRGRIVRQLLTESILLSIMGGAVGLAVAAVGIRAFEKATPPAFPRLGEVALDVPVLAFAALVSLGSCFIFGAAPSLHASNIDVMDLLREGRRHSASLWRQRLRSSFVVTQIALALVLLIGSGLMIRSVMRLNTVQFGFNPDSLITVQIPFSRSFYHSVPGTWNTPSGGLLVEFDSRFSELSERIRERLASVPGVESATAAVTTPLGEVPRRINFVRQGEQVNPAERDLWSAEWYPVSSDYFSTLKIPLLRGRAIDGGDAYPSRPVVVINASMAERYWRNEDPVGKLVQLDLLDDKPREIVGVVGDVRQNRYERELQPQMYIPRAQLPYRMDMAMSLKVLVTTFIVRTQSDLAGIANDLRAAVREVDRSQPISSMSTVGNYAAGQL